MVEQMPSGSARSNVGTHGAHAGGRTSSAARTRRAAELTREMESRRAVLVCRNYYTLDSSEVRAAGKNEFDDETYVGPRIIEESIEELQALQRLRVENTRIESVPLAVGKVRSLRNLTLINNPLLNHLDSNLVELRNLEGVLIQNCPISKIPDFGWNQRKSLSHVTASKCGVESIPETFGELHSLIHLVMPRNKISKLPPQLGEAKQLVNLNLEGNRIRDANVVRHFQKLRTL